MAYGKILVTCPLNWGTEERIGQSILEKAVSSYFFPVYEIEEGITTMTQNLEIERFHCRVGWWT